MTVAVIDGTGNIVNVIVASPADVAVTDGYELKEIPDGLPVGDAWRWENGFIPPDRYALLSGAKIVSILFVRHGDPAPANYMAVPDYVGCGWQWDGEHFISPPAP